MSTELATGRELDALVAEKVMGWVVVRDDARDWIEIIGDGPQTLTLAAVPRYSTDIAAAWEVVEKLGDLFLWMDRKDSKWYVAMRPRWEDLPGLGVAADTAPLAICRAALEAAA